MKHSIDKSKAAPFGEFMAEAIETCVHCGFCLPACPTYAELGQEADSPRGRIFLMKQVLEDELQPEDIAEHVDQCLGCLACETACPSGVKYRDLISPYRATVDRNKTFWEKIRDQLVRMTLPFPNRFRWAMRMGRLTRFLAFLAPPALRPMTDLIPDSIPKPIRLNENYAAIGDEKCEVLLLAGCAQQVLAPEINLHTIRLLNFCGAKVTVPVNQSCCGALSWHQGDAEQAKKLAVGNFNSFLDSPAEWIVTNAAGCGSGMKEYGLLFRNSEHEEQATRFATKVIDVSVLLFKLGFIDHVNQMTSERMLGEKHSQAGSEKIPMESVIDESKVRVAYHDACHLSHGQGVRIEPRALLRAMPGVELCELPGPERCCGSAGTYNIEQPKIAKELGEAKAEAIVSTSADYLVTGNIGCMVQIQNQLRAQGSPIQVLHLVDFLAKRLRLSDG